MFSDLQILAKFSPESWYLPTLAVAALLCLQFSRWTQRRSRRLPLPPGPKGFPIIGNLLQVLGTKTHPWVMYRDLSKEYGDMVYLDIFGQPVLVLSSLKAIGDLLDRRASNYSDRPSVPSLSMIKLDWALTIMNYGPWWRAHRKIFHQYFNKTQIPKYAPVLEHQTLLFLRRLVENPHNFLEDAKYLFGAMILQISYGLDTDAEIRELSDAGEAIVQGFGECSEPGHFLVDTFPILRFVPAWFPGAGWKRRLLGVAELSQRVLKKTFDDVHERVRSGKSGHGEVPDVASHIIENLPPKDHPEYIARETIARNTTLVAYAGGADTTVSSGHSLFAALANYPQVQRSAQQELDAVVGHERLPKVSDLPHLPYLQALVKELLRWHSVVPMAVPHICKEDDEYNGYFIPKGTAVMGNTWAIMHDPEIFEDPMEFKPERYLTHDPITHQLKMDTSILDAELAVFGYGRRVCPGRHLSSEALTLMAASLLAIFDVKPMKDANGKPVKIEIETGNGLVVKPAPFEVEVVPRSPRHASIVSRDE